VIVKIVETVLVEIGMIGGVIQVVMGTLLTPLVMISMLMMKMIMVIAMRRVMGETAKLPVTSTKVPHACLAMAEIKYLISAQQSLEPSTKSFALLSGHPLKLEWW
jgi:hypothetical protein